MKKRIFAAILAAAMTFTAAPALLPAADISVSAAKAEKLPAPSRIDVVGRTEDSVTLLWDLVEGADGYVLYSYNAKTKKYEKLKNLKEKDYLIEYYGTKYPSYKVEGMKKGETYQFKIAARVKGKDGKYTVQTKSKAVKVKLIDAPEFSIPAVGMTETEFFKTNESNAFSLNYYPMAKDPVHGYFGNVLYQGKPAKAEVFFDDEGRIESVSLHRKDIKKSVFQRERDRLTQIYGEPYDSQDKTLESTGENFAAASWFLQEDKDRGMIIDYSRMNMDQQWVDLIWVIYVYEQADELAESAKKKADPFAITPQA